MESRFWCFTLNNYVAADYRILKLIPHTYLIYGREISSTGTPHLQGYITLIGPMTLRDLKKYHPRVHWEIARSSEASRRYCMKDGDYEEFTACPVTSKIKKERKIKTHKTRDDHIFFTPKNLPILDLILR